MTHKLEFSTSCQDFDMVAPEDIASLKCGDISVSFLSSAKWQIGYKPHDDATKESIAKFLANQSSGLMVILVAGGIGANCFISVAENKFKIKVTTISGNFTIANILSCDFEENKQEVMKFVNYLHQQFEANVN